ncbi:MAG: GAF domain-containing protein [Gammaproteobacteria bacterium]
MSRRYPLLILVTIILILGSGYQVYTAFKPSGLPFGVTLVDARTAVVEPITGIPLPPGLQTGDRIDLPASDPPARIALLPDILVEANLSGAHTYKYTLRKDHALISVPVASVDISQASGGLLLDWLIAIYTVLFAVVILLLFWRGQNRASAGMSLWAMAVWSGNIFTLTHVAGGALLASQLLATTCFLLARAGFYLTIEFMLGVALTPSRRTLFRGIFLLILLAGAFQQFGGTLIFVATGRAELLRPVYGFVFSAAYVVPVVMLYMSYGMADAAQRLRLRWILWSSVIWVLAIMLSNTPLPWLGPLAINSIYLFGFVVTLAGFLYAVLRHRALDVSVAIDRTLVYGSVTALVVGVLAALNSVLQHAALGTGASLLLQIVVPLALGIVLGQVRNYAGKFVERVFFRRKYLAEKALRRFARHCHQFEASAELLRGVVGEIHRRLNVPTAVIYERDAEGYRCTQREGGLPYPDQVKPDDPAFVAARADQKGIDLTDLHSALGSDGHVFPMAGPGGMQGVLVCANRPGEHFASDECKLLSYVARQAGMALYALRVQEILRRAEANSRLVHALASGTLSASPEIQAQARELANAAAAG